MRERLSSGRTGRETFGRFQSPRGSFAPIAKGTECIFILIGMALSGGAIVAGCSPEAPSDFDPCPWPNLRGGFNIDDTVRTPLTDASGAVVAEVGRVGVNLYLRRDALPYDGQFSLAFQGVRFPGGGPDGSDVIIDVPIGTTTTILTAGVGTSLTNSGASKIRVSGVDGLNPPACTAEGQLSTRVEIVNARGSLDPAQLIIDRDYARRMAVSFDWHDLGCGLSSVRGTVILTFTMANLGFNCKDSVRLVGDAGPRVPFVDSGAPGG